MPNEIIVVNKHHGNKEGDRTIYIGRPSTLGNPFSITDLQTREMVVANYRKWIEYKLSQGDEAVIKELERIGALAMDDSGQPVHLLCFCSPLSCHGDVIKEVIEAAIKEQSA